jgi:hypothetical protein
VTEERRNFNIDSPIFSGAVCFVFISKAVQIEGQDTRYVTCSVRVYIHTGSCGLSFGEIPNALDCCLAGAMDRFVFGRMTFIQFSHFMDMMVNS